MRERGGEDPAFRSRYPDLDDAQVEGFTYDRASAKRFHLRFLPGLVLGLALFASPFVTALGSEPASLSPWWFAVFVAGMAVIGATQRMKYLARPAHFPSGRLMHALRNPANPDVLEIVYVDRASRSFFKVQYLSRIT